MIKHKHLYAFHPGYFVKQIIEDEGVTQDEFAARLGITSKTLSELVNGKINLSKEVAEALSSMLGTSVEMWLNLQKKYIERLVEIEIEKKLAEQKPYLETIDFHYFVQNANLKTTKGLKEKIQSLCACLKLASLSLLGEEVRMASYRISSQKMDRKSAICARAWLMFALAKANNNRIIGKVDTDRLTDFVPEIRAMIKRGVIQSLPRLEEIFTSCGVTFVYLPMLKDAKISGAVKWAADKKSVTLAINDRFKKEDAFWFTLFHEIKHVLQRSYNRTYVSVDEDDAIMDEQDIENEKDADQFAIDILIPADKYADLLADGDFSTRAIRRFSALTGIDEGITAGRLAKEGHVDFKQANHLRKSFSL